MKREHIVLLPKQANQVLKEVKIIDLDADWFSQPLVIQPERCQMQYSAKRLGLLGIQATDMFTMDFELLPAHCSTNWV